MKLLIPTAKEMNLDTPEKTGHPVSNETQAVIDALAALSLEGLASLYKISEDRASEEEQRIQALKSETAKTYPALKLFDGLMYRNIRRTDWTEAEAAYVQNHLLITSALYGVIPALTPIAPHRLDFLMKLKVQGKSLKTFWKAVYDQALEEEDLIISLLSSEFETVFSKEIQDRMLTFKFLEEKNGQLKVHSTISKKARGAFVSALLENQITKVEEMKQLSFNGFAYQDDLSTDKQLVFVKYE
ncbi:peroxide stress protein YaaA [uncultured Streptococcus sp.]|uniref:peroxide stress protein YaaA n=1 Tax=uncultured Streptococcus sp. TaxID=83427 RepID=UPI0028EB50ED|nr:peroxide stress protein YaaA [uncultured Streptococcus sp.]